MSTPESPPGGWGYAKENPMTAPDRPTPEVRDEWVKKFQRVLDSRGALIPGAENTRAALAAVVPLVQSDVGERIAAAMVETPADRVTWDDGTEFISSADAQRIARAVATGDEGGQ